MHRRRVRDMRTLSHHLKQFFSGELVQAILYLLLFIGLSSLFAYGFFVDYETAFAILFYIVFIAVWLVVSFILLCVGLMNFIEQDWDDKLTGLLVGGLGALSFGGLISTCISSFL